MWMDSYAGGKVPALLSPAPNLQYFFNFNHYDGVKQLNWLKANGVSGWWWIPLPVSEITYCDYQPKKKQKKK